MARLRVFIAVDPDKAIRSRCVALQETLARADPEVRWVAPETMHLTLVFLGEVDERQLPSICQVVSAVCAEHDAFVLQVQGVGCFPNMNRPRTVWVGVGSGADELIALHHALEERLMELGCYRREDRQFTPHLTLGRVKGDLSGGRLPQALVKQAQWHGGEVEIGEVLVMSSELFREGPVYSLLSTARLRQGTRPSEQEQ
jgi:2'-5' RNA ligase